MHPSKNMTKVIGGKRYSIATATLIASNEYWDGSSFERGGHNAFLYRTRGNAYFRVSLTQWENERDTITPLSRGEAMQLWDELPEKAMSYNEAFDVEPEDALAGRSSLYGAPMRQTAIWLPEDMITWLKAQGGMSETVRKLIDAAMG